VLDPGHGESDTGAVNKQYNLKESEEVLEVAYILKASSRRTATRSA
jgi:N-acetylmuramoyl-L-alanine amidase